MICSPTFVFNVHLSVCCNHVNPNVTWLFFGIEFKSDQSEKPINRFISRLQHLCLRVVAAASCQWRTTFRHRGTYYRLRIQIVLVFGLRVALARSWPSTVAGSKSGVKQASLPGNGCCLHFTFEAITDVIYSGSDRVHSDEEGTKWG